MKTKYLNKQWHTGEGRAQIVVYNSSGQCIGTANETCIGIDRDEAKNNAKLMAAAPEMLTALLECEVLITKEFPTVYKMVRDAIAKARGEQCAE